jgi:glutathione S-transferase
MGILRSVPKLYLYQYETCWYCMRVRRVIDELGLDVELRNVRRDPTHRADLIAARGRKTVPVLRIDNGDGNDVWMPESADIIDYLRSGGDLPLADDSEEKPQSKWKSFSSRRS